MLIWGGLLYLRNLDLATVWKLSAARDAMLLDEPADVARLRFRYLPLERGGRSRLFVRAGLALYWLLGRGRRRWPRSEPEFGAAGLVKPRRFLESLVYEEAGLTSSDSRFALQWILAGRDEARVALNHCGLERGHWERKTGTWRLGLEDRLGGAPLEVRTRTLINAGGIWADRINQQCGVESAHRHVLSKGVYLAFERPESLDEALVFEMGEHGDSQTFTPWGPVALWGPTETAVECIEDGLAPTVDDVRFLLGQANRNLVRQRGPEDVVSLRCGIRPLAVKRGFRAAKYPLDLSRKHVVERDTKSAALTLFGGKITSAHVLAREAADALEQYLIPRQAPVRTTSQTAPQVSFPGLDAELPDPGWCQRHEACATLDDYLRRRTNLSQWVPRQALGRSGENTEHLVEIARAIHTHPEKNKSTSASQSDETAAQAAVAEIRRRAHQQDQLLGAV
jgi:glycerol-3-phosphate dehydrogenase